MHPKRNKLHNREFFGELCPICEKCRDLSEDELVIMTASGLTLEGESVLVIEGHSSITGKPAKVKLTDFGFEFFGDDVTEEEVARVRNARCCYIGTVDTSKES